MAEASSTTGILMAAGASVRFGSSKLLASYGGEPLVVQSARTLRHLPLARHIAVCREHDEVLASLLLAEGYDIAFNRDAARGMSTSIAVGMAAMTNSSAVLICLADMPAVTVRHLEEVVNSLGPGGAVTSTTIDGAIRSPPAAFDQRHFAELRRLAGDRGARELLRRAVAIPTALSELVDIDTKADLDALTPRTDQT